MERLLLTSRLSYVVEEKVTRRLRDGSSGYSFGDIPSQFWRTRRKTRFERLREPG